MNLREGVQRRRPTLDQVSQEIFDNPELGFAEHRAVTTLTDALSAGGFQVTHPVADIDTAFVAVHEGSETGATVAILAEYDALPGIGHGCGHNLIAAGAVTAALAAVDAWPDHPGTLTVIGTPAEEGGGGKILLADRGVFDHVDAAMMFHPSDRSLRSKHALAASHATVTFTGLATHAAKTPWEGRSALAATQVFLVALDAMRQFLPPTARLHYVIREGGHAPQMVPDRASVSLSARDRTAAGADDLVRRVRLAAEGAAIATETQVVVDVDPLQYSDRINNMTMADHFARTFEEQGIDMPAGEPDEPSGSSDIGNVSQLVPTIHPCVNITHEPTPGHSDAFKEAAGSVHGADQTELAAFAMAKLAQDLLDPSTGLLNRARDEYRQGAVPTGLDRTAG